MKLQDVGKHLILLGNLGNEYFWSCILFHKNFTSFIKPRNAVEPPNISYNKRFVFQNKIGFCDIGMVKIVKNSKTDSG